LGKLPKIKGYPRDINGFSEEWQLLLDDYCKKGAKGKFSQNICKIIAQIYELDITSGPPNIEHCCAKMRIAYKYARSCYIHQI
jgi:hypothetical protein